MKRKKIFAVFVCSWLLTSPFASVANSKPVPVASKGETSISAKLPKFDIKVMIKTHEADIGKPSDPKPATIDNSCTYSRCPCSLVDRLDIMVNGSEVLVPRSVFCDLADINTMELKTKNDTPTLIISGGDASESYLAHVEFDAKQVKRKIIWDGFSEKPLYIITYNKLSVVN